MTPVEQAEPFGTAAVEYTLALAGHETAHWKVVPDQDRDVFVALVPATPPLADPPAPKPAAAKRRSKRPRGRKPDAPAGFRDSR